MDFPEVGQMRAEMHARSARAQARPLPVEDIPRGLKSWDELTSRERLDAILLAVWDITVGAQCSGATAAHIAMGVARYHPMRYPRMSHNGKAMSTATRVTPGIIALRRRGLIGFAYRPGGRTGTADTLTAKGWAYVRRAQSLAGMTQDEYRVMLSCMGQLEMPKAPPEEKRAYVPGGPKPRGAKK